MSGFLWVLDMVWAVLGVCINRGYMETESWRCAPPGGGLRSAPPVPARASAGDRPPAGVYKVCSARGHHTHDLKMSLRVELRVAPEICLLWASPDGALWGIFALEITVEG